MAALTFTDGAEGRVPYGDDTYVKRFVVTVANSAAADEWIPTGFSTVVGVVGHAVKGTTDRGVNFVINALGTGQAAGSTLGVLGIEATGACTVDVTVIGQE